MIIEGATCKEIAALSAGRVFIPFEGSDPHIGFLNYCDLCSGAIGKEGYHRLADLAMHYGRVPVHPLQVVDGARMLLSILSPTAPRPSDAVALAAILLARKDEPARAVGRSLELCFSKRRPSPVFLEALGQTLGVWMVASGQAQRAPDIFASMLFNERLN